MNRIIRVLEYEGTPEWLESAIANRTVKEEMRFSQNGVIREGIIGRSTSMVEPEVPYQGTNGLYELLMASFQDHGLRLRNIDAGGVGGQFSAGQSADELLVLIKDAGLRLVRA